MYIHVPHFYHKPSIRKLKSSQSESSEYPLPTYHLMLLVGQAVHVFSTIQVIVNHLQNLCKSSRKKNNTFLFSNNDSYKYLSLGKHDNYVDLR